MAFKMLKNLLV